MAKFNVSLVLFMTMMVASMQYQGTMAQTRHVVGDALGWTIPSGGAAAYTTWASLQTFNVGDILVFNFTNGIHDVAEVSAAAYGPCTSTNPISLVTTGPASLPLTTAGTHYYICTFSSHCQLGQRLAINVSATSTTMPPSTMPTTPASPPTTTPTPPSAAAPMTPPVEPCPPTSSPSSPTSSPSYSPSSPPTFTTDGMTPPSAPSSGASSFPAMISATLLAIGLAFMNL